MRHVLTVPVPVETKAIITARLPAALVGLFCVLGTAGNSWAQRLFTVETGFDDSALAEVDKTSGAILHLYPGQQELLVSGLAHDSSTNTLFAAGTYPVVDGRRAALYTVDYNTGQFSLVGDMGLVGIGPIISGLAVHPATSVLYGMTYLGDLYTIDKASGAGSLIGSDDEDELMAVHGLDFSPNGVLYAADTQGSIPTSTLFTIKVSTGDPTFAATIDRDYVVGLAFDSAGVLYGSDNGSASLITIDTLSGAATTVGAYGSGGGHSSLAFVPEPGTVVMLIGAGLLGLVAYIRRRCNLARCLVP